jgi:hypothetical protein
LISKSRRSASPGNSSNGPDWLSPALLTSTSTVSSVGASASTDDGEVRSSGTNSISPGGWEPARRLVPITR